MTRLLGLLALAAVLWLLLEIGWARLRKAVKAGWTVSSLKPPEAGETLVRCSGCGVYVPRGQVVAGACERCRPPRERGRG
ncbi:MAG TPA: hypothetical protein VN493_14210 [Thermoanaerobaculia bacterium]|nr:hypothetical protein [Thermoanaerobaculia bacterium]